MEPLVRAAIPPLRVIVTGASSGIGMAIARAFVAAGADVQGVARRASAMSEAAAAWGPGTFTAHGVDIRDAAAVRAVVAEVASGGGIDVLILAAGTNLPERSLAELSAEGWDQIVRTNLDSTFHFVSAALGPLRRSRGLVISISSVSGRWPDASGPAYQASKAGMLAFAAAAAYEEQRGGVRFTSILPGRVDTPLLDRRKSRPSAEIRKLSLRPADLAEVCLFVARLPPSATIPELTILPTALQTLGNHWPGLPVSSAADPAQPRPPVRHGAP